MQMDREGGPQPEGEEPFVPLLRDQKRCRALLAATDAIVWTTSPDGRFVEPQASWCAYTGQTWEQAEGDGWRAAVHPADLEALVSAWSLALGQKEQYHAACRIWHAASQQHRACVIRASAIKDAGGDIVEWVGAVTDIHDRPMSLQEAHRVNDALKHQLEAYHTELERLFSVSLDVMVSVGADGRLVTVSPSFEAVTGYTVAEARGEVFERFVLPEDLPKTWDEIRRVMTGSYNAVDFEMRVLRKDGAQRLVSWRAVGSVTEGRLYAVGRDITEQRREAEQLVRAQRLEAVGQLTGGIAHDFNNILAALISYLEVAKRLVTRDPARLPRILDSALDAGRRGAKLVRQLLSFARQEQLSIGPVDLNELVEGMKEMIDRTLGGTIRIRYDLDRGIRAALADRTQLESALLNLCINARDAMADGGTLTIRTSRISIAEDPATRIDDLPRGDYAVLTVEDTGAGMDKATLARCVEPFFTTKSPGKGTGLGLSQVVGFAQQCGGNVRVESQPGAGTRVDVVLPKVSPSDTPVPEPDSRQAPPSLSAATVLLVDDNAAVLHSTAELLSMAGYQVIEAAAPSAAMSVVLSGRPFDVLLTDYAMPEMTGVELATDALRHRPKLVAVIVSGYSDFDAVRAQLPGVTVLRKPFEPAQLFEALDGAVRAHRLHTGER